MTGPPSDDAFPQRLLAVRETRARLPEIVRNRHVARRRRSWVGHDGRLLLLDVPSAQVDRDDLLRRLVIAVTTRGVDGVIASADIVDDLLLLEALDDRLVVGVMNRDGAYTGYDVETIAATHLDAGLLACDLDRDDPGDAAPIEAYARILTGLAAQGVVAIVALSGERGGGSLVRTVVRAASLGGRSSYTWLAVPLADGLSDVTSATTLPVLLVADTTTPAPAAIPAEWERGLAVAGVRGLIVGPSVLFPPDGDVAAAATRAARLVHGEPPRRDDPA